MKAALLTMVVLLASCRVPAGGSGPVYEPPEGKRAASLVVDKSQTQFLSPGDTVEILMLIETSRADAAQEVRSETLAARAEVLRVKNDWSEGTGLVSLALSPEEAQYAALAADREDRLYLNKIAAEKIRLKQKTPAPKIPALENDQRGLAVLVYPDQQEFLSAGDRVDVILTRHGFKAGGKSELTAITALQDLTVLRASPPEGDEEWSTVQLRVTPEQGRLLTHAVAGGDHLSFTIRAAADAATRAIEAAKMSRRIGLEAEHASPRL